MAIFHLTTKIISRGKGQSAIAAAAYRSGEKLIDEQTGEVKHYRTREERILYTDIMAPLHAPEWAFDRNQLWNHAERAEKRKDAQLAREIEIALPHELTDQQREWLVKDFAREQFVRKGYAVDIAIHGPDSDSDRRNYHAHLMVTLRQIGPDGFAKDKETTEQREAKRKHGQTREQELGHWREQWANLANRHLERHGHEARIDHRSLKEQGIDREPTVHLGYAANEMTARGAPSDRMDALNEILARNELRFDLAAIDAELRTLEQEQDKERQKAAQDRARQGQGATVDPSHDAYLAAMEARRKLNEQPRETTAEQAHAPQPTPDKSRQDQQKPDAEQAQQKARDQNVGQGTKADTRPDATHDAYLAAMEARRKLNEQPRATEPKPDERKQDSPKPRPGTTRSEQPSGEWTIGKSWVQNPHGQHMPYVSPEHIAASQRAAEQVQAAARAAGQKPAADLGKEAQTIRQQARTEQKIETREQRQEQAHANWQKRAQAQNPDKVSMRDVRHKTAQAGKTAAHTGLRVFNRATGIVSSLGSFVDSLLATTPREPKPEKIDFHTLMNDPEAARRYDEQHMAEAQRRNLHPDVLDDIKRDIEAGRDLKAEDISKLPREHLEQIKAKGDAYVTQLAASARDWSEKYWGGGNDWSGGYARGRERGQE